MSELENLDGPDVASFCCEVCGDVVFHSIESPPEEERCVACSEVMQWSHTISMQSGNIVTASNNPSFTFLQMTGVVLSGCYTTNTMTFTL